MNEKLRERLRQFQNMITESKKRETLLHNQLDQAKAKLKSNECSTKIQAEPNANAVPSPPVGKNSGDPQEMTESTDGKETFPNPFQSKVSRSILSVPSGGFMFGPSPPSASSNKTEPPPENSIPGKIINSNVKENPKAEGNSKKQMVQTSQQPSKNDEASLSLRNNQSTIDSNTLPRRPSAESKEISIKERLMERKRKLMLDMQMKQDVLRKNQNVTQNIPPTTKQPPEKRVKITLEEDPKPPSGFHTTPGEKRNTLIDISSSDLQIYDSNHTEVQNKTKHSLSISSKPEQSPKEPDPKCESVIPLLPAPEPTTSQRTPPSQIAPKNDQQKDTIPKKADLATTFSSPSFLDIKPPGHSPKTPKFQFGSSNEITLPTPALPHQTNIFNVFPTSKPFNGAVNTKPLFGTPVQNSTTEGQAENTPDEATANIP